MFVVRYVALAALVVWLGGLIVVGVIVVPAQFDVLQPANPALARVFGLELLRQVHLLSYVCGGVLLVALFVMKFVGPPPVAFPPRAAIVAAMLASSVYSGYFVLPEISAAHAHAGATHDLQQRSTLLMILNIALGSALLYWYARE
jgi:hypothetical protein